MAGAPRRKNFTDVEDLALLRQTHADRPFLRQRGGIMAAWEALATKLVADENFPRNKLSGKTASGRFDKLVEAHRAAAEKSAKASGVDEDEDESKKVILLDDLVAMLDDHAAKTAAAKAAELQKREREEETSLVARRPAMESLKESGDDSTPVKKRKETGLKDLLINIKEKELAERQAVRELEAECRRREREEDRDESARARREANEQMLRLVSVIGDAVLAVVKANKGD
ncbi:uncharacterized protein PITG_02413 [Phytophthora infestans T30-4]|uniref:Myb-like domain-containing protein n=2 Tax=Phytophthora infestans TaxID=4787 RepID=D0MW91_PHYIT|nr:uncharacterized protein PITG_02413 [Phytophthora infestans T30-4]EEY63904.1 conserved hypothetical protein [Phytophthora infestans T30-4]KAF4146675.1 hypothetical protein GN958_ATG04158 [Phytophthora infestans]KAI9986781.1 hypothetical protein PInf_025738 [Phytophthora infestans]|eukprot:XP_002907340.1 conserved hypothetical protein [Phytophthora infestans T30-4]